jgi:hypothetical protein
VVVRPHILQGAPSSKLAMPPQLPAIGLFLTITPIAIAAKESAITINNLIKSNSWSYSD